MLKNILSHLSERLHRWLDFDRSTVDKELAKNAGKEVNMLIDSLTAKTPITAKIILQNYAFNISYNKYFYYLCSTI